jgi:hypothetical protein
MSILSALKQQNSSIDDLAALPQAMIMQMAQKKQIDETMLAPILARKAEMADAFARQNALQNAGQTPPTVMEQLMAQNAQAEQPAMEDTGVAQLPMPERQYAGGGIIAFADGGMSDEDYEDYEDKVRKSKHESIFNEMMTGLKSLPSRASDMISGLPMSYEATKAAQSQQSSPVQSRGSHPYEAQVIQEAQRQGVDPNLALHVLYKETGNLKNPESARSKAGAIGVMQLMPGTAKELGVDPTDPSQNIAGGVAYLKKMYNKYQDPALAAAGYNAGPGRLDKALRADNGLNSLSRETRNYIVGLAEGGEVRHFDDGGYTDLGAPVITSPEMGSYSDVYKGYQSLTPGSPEFLLENKQITEQEYKNIKARNMAKEAPTANKANATKPMSNNEAMDKFLTQHLKNNPGQTNVPTQVNTPVQTTPEQDYFAELMAQNKEARAELKKSAAEDKNLAILAAGLGMMGGTSPYAFTNIGLGGQKGVEQYGASKARRASELAALNKSDIGALEARELGKYRQSVMSANSQARLSDDYRLAEKNIIDRVTKGLQNNPTYLAMKPNEQAALVAQQVDALKGTDPYFKGLSQQLGVQPVPAMQQNKYSGFSGRTI